MTDTVKRAMDAAFALGEADGADPLALGGLVVEMNEAEAELRAVLASANAGVAPQPATHGVRFPDDADVQAVLDDEQFQELRHLYDSGTGNTTRMIRRAFDVFQERTLDPRSTPTLNASPTDADFAEAMRILSLVVTMPEGREHTSVPCDDLRCLARVITAQQAHIVNLEAEEWRRAESGARFRSGRDGNYDGPTLRAPEVTKDDVSRATMVLTQHPALHTVQIHEIRAMAREILRQHEAAKGSTQSETASEKSECSHPTADEHYRCLNCGALVGQGLRAQTTGRGTKE